MNDVTLLAKALKKIADAQKDMASKIVVEDIVNRVQALEEKPDAVQLVKNEIAKLVNGAPEEFDTLKELSDALNDEKNAVAAINKVLATKADKNECVTKLQHTQDLALKADKVETTITDGELKKSIEEIVK